jgi:hypothetical protein
MLLIGAASLLVLCDIIPEYRALAQSPTDTPTPTPTLSNGDLIQLATPAAPSTCGSIFAPCGSLPWIIPQMPTVALPSPTLYPTMPTDTPIPATTTPTNTPTLDASITPTATITPTPEFDFSDAQTLTARMEHISETLSAQSTQMMEVSGTPQNIAGMATQIGGNTTSFFSTVKGVVVAASASRALSIVAFVFFCLMFVFIVKLALFVIPLVKTFLEFVLQVVSAIKPW